MSRIRDVIVAHLGPHLGQHVAGIAVKTFAKKALDLEPEDITPIHLPQLYTAMRPMLKVMLGGEQSDAVLDSIQRELA